MEDTKKEKEIWELNQEELLHYIYTKNNNFLCVNEEQFKFWKELFYDKLPEIKTIKVNSPEAYPCVLRFMIYSHNSPDFTSYHENSIYITYAPSYSVSSYPWRGIKDLKVITDYFITCPDNLNVCTSIDKVEQYKHKLLNQEI